MGGWGAGRLDSIMPAVDADALAGFKRGYLHLVAGTLSLRAFGPATIQSHKCDIHSFLKHDQSCARQSLAGTLLARSVAASSYSHPSDPVATRMSLPLVCLAPV